MSPRDARAAFELRDVSVCYGAKEVLQLESLDVGNGESVAVIGPSGAGKSTLLGLLNASVKPSSGSIRVGETPLGHLTSRELRQLRAGIGLIPQNLALIPNLSVLQNVLSGGLGRMSLASSLRAMLSPAAKDRITAHEILERVGISDKLYERCDRLSGGELQRVAIARALFQDPIMLLADEPVSSVDPARALSTIELLTEISRERGLTLLVCLHNVELARDHFGRLLGLRRGRIEFDHAAGEVTDAEIEALYLLENENGAPRDG